MKKIYEAPALVMTQVSAPAFLEVSGEVWAVDQFNDNYGETFI